MAKFDFDIFIKANADSFRAAISAAQNALKHLADSSKDSSEKMISAFSTFSTSAQENVASMAQNIAVKMLIVGKDILTSIGGVLTKIFPAVETTMVAIVDGIGVAIGAAEGPIGIAVMTALEVIATTAFFFIKDMIGGVFNFIGTAINSFVQTAIPILKDAISSLVSLSISFVTNLASGIIQLGGEAFSLYKSFETLKAGIASVNNESFVFKDQYGRLIEGSEKFRYSQVLTNQVFDEFVKRAKLGYASIEDYIKLYASSTAILTKTSKPGTSGDEILTKATKLAEVAAEIKKLFPYEYTGSSMLVAELSQLLTGNVLSRSHLTQQLGLVGKEAKEHWKEIVAQGKAADYLLQHMGELLAGQKGIANRLATTLDSLKTIFQVDVLLPIFKPILAQIEAFVSRVRDKLGFFSPDMLKEFTNEAKNLLALPFSELSFLVQRIFYFIMQSPDLLRSIGAFSSIVLTKTIQLLAAAFSLIENNKDRIIGFIDALSGLVSKIPVDKLVEMVGQLINYLYEAWGFLLGLKGFDFNKVIEPIKGWILVVKGLGDGINSFIIQPLMSLFSFILAPLNLIFTIVGNIAKIILGTISKIPGFKGGEAVENFMKEIELAQKRGKAELEASRLEALRDRQIYMGRTPAIAKMFEPLPTENLEGYKKRLQTGEVTATGNIPTYGKGPATAQSMFEMIADTMMKLNRKLDSSEVKFKTHQAADDPRQQVVTLQINVGGKKGEEATGKFTPQELQKLKNMLQRLDDVATRGRLSQYNINQIEATPNRIPH